MSELKPCSDANGHCWHEGYAVLASNPPQYEQTCCWCGQVRHITLWIGDPVPQPHGPHAARGRDTIAWDFSAPNLTETSGVGVWTETAP